MLLIDGGTTPVPVPPWGTTTIAPLDHGGIALSTATDNVLAIALLILGVVLIVVALLTFVFSKGWLGIGVAVSLALAGLGVCIAATLVGNSGLSARDAAVIKWASARYDITLTDSAVSTLAHNRPVAIDHLGQRFEIHAVEATDGRTYLFDGSGHELPTSVSTGTGGK